MSNKVLDLLDDVETKLQAIAAVKGKIVSADTEEELVRKLKGLLLPAVGVIYGGIRAIPEPQPSYRLGLSGELSFVLVVVSEKNKLTKDSLRASNIELLDGIRSVLKGNVSPTGHRYRFVIEMPAADDGERIMWVQRWAVPIQLT